MKSVYISTLTPLRGIAAILVVVFHCNLMLQPFLPYGVTEFVNMGWMWVDLFFVLSGFVILHVYGSDFEARVNGESFKRYVKARFARIYPLHFVTLLLVLPFVIFININASKLDWFFAQILDLKSIPATVALVHALNLVPQPTLNTPSWSLSAEWWTYLIFPFLVPLIIKRGRAEILSYIALIFGGYFALMYLLGPKAGVFGGGSPTLNVLTDYGFIRCLLGFAFGMCLRNLYGGRMLFRFFSTDLAFVFLASVTLIGMHLGWHPIAMVLFFGLIILAASYNSGRVKAALDRPLMQKLGDLSFSIYMIHVPLIVMVWAFRINRDPAYFSDFGALVRSAPDYTSGVIHLVGILISTLLFSSILYKYVEVPGRRMLKGKG